MNNETNEPSENPSEKGNSSNRFHGLGKRRHQAGENASDAVGKGVKVGGRWLRITGHQTQTAVANIPAKLGEDYALILAQNPLVTGTLARQDLLTNNKELLETAYNIPWRSLTPQI
ncbi:MAG: hypothetical protein KC441_13345 [Anaerolineales bacterium]|nr:hypothetical protein [Anaerolineales bacterium]